MKEMIRKITEFVKSDTFKKLFKFGIIGVLNTAVDYGSFSLYHYVFGWGELVAQLLAVITAATNSYVLNNNITFKKEKQYGIMPYLKFMSVNFVSMGISVGLMYLFSNVWGLEPILAKIPISAITILLSFTVYNKLVFKKK